MAPKLNQKQHNLELLEAEARHAGLLAITGSRAYKQHYTHIWEDNGVSYLQQYFSEARIKSDLQNTDVTFYLILNHTEAVGILKMVNRRVLPLAEHGRQWQLEKLYLHQNAVGAGLGNQIMKRLFVLGKANGYQYLWLDAINRSKALRFYLKVGFKPVSKHQLDYAQLKPEYKEMQRLKYKL